MPNFYTSINGADAFRLRRTLASTQGQEAAPDSTVADVLSRLDTLLRKEFIRQGANVDQNVKDFVDKELQAERKGGTWKAGSLVDFASRQVEAPGEKSLAGTIAGVPDAADLRLSLDVKLNERRWLIDPSVRIVLEYDGVRDLVFARAWYSRNIKSPDGLLNFVLSDPDGVYSVIGYAIVSAARKVAQDEGLEAPELQTDKGKMWPLLVAASPKLTEGGFRQNVLDFVRGQLKANKFEEFIKIAGIAPNIPQYLRTRLVTLLKQSPVPITNDNAPFLVQMYLQTAAAASPDATDTRNPLDPFAVELFGDDFAAQSVNAAAVQCAAQLFYVMTLGDDLGVFDAVRYFTESSLFQEQLAITDPVLRKDLEDYVFSNRFPVVDRTTGLTDKVTATREPMRRAYYRQVFNSGDAPTAGDAPVNEEFGRLWKVLILESARYLERAQVSPHPGSYVSRQNVMRAVEDLQYNLSTSCVGLVTVMAPTMNDELTFVIKRILNHPEIRSHVVPGGGSWLKVIDRLAAARGRRARTSVINTKARLGYSLIRSIADYTPSAFEQDAPFSDFISKVDEFITTQSILQADMNDKDDESSDARGSASETPGPPGMPDLSKLPGMPPNLIPSQGSGPVTGDEWDF